MNLLRYATRAARAYLANLILFVPIIVFVRYATWHGAPSPERWLEAYRLGGALAAVELGVLLALRQPLNRLMLGANAYLLAGGALAALQLFAAFKVFAALQASAVLISMLMTGLITTWLTRGGFVGAPDADPAAVRRASLALLGVAALSTLLALAFRGHAILGATLPILALGAASALLRRRLRLAGAAAVARGAAASRAAGSRA